MPKVTPWFPASVKPVRVGVYEVKAWPGISAWRLWNGTNWMCYCFNREQAVRETLTGDKLVEWRGLAAKPKDVR